MSLRSNSRRLARPHPSLRVVPVVVAAVALVALSTGVAAADRRAVVEKCKQATALVDLGLEGSGTAFCVKQDGLFLTNFHVVRSGLEQGTVTLIVRPGSSDEQSLTARIVNVDEENDLALIYAPSEGLTALDLGETGTLFETMDVTIFGYPFGEQLSFDEGAYPAISVVTGRVSALRRDKGQLKAIQIDGGINPGHSGGPVVDEDGAVVAVIFTGIPGSNVGFAIPLDTLHAFLDRPGLLIDVPDLTYVDRTQPVDLDVGIVTYDDDARPDGLHAVVRRSVDESETIEAEAVSNGYRVSFVPEVGETAGPQFLISVSNDAASQWSSIEDLPLRVGSRELQLAEIRKIERRAEISLVTTNYGDKLAGALSVADPAQENGALVQFSESDRIDVYQIGSVTRLIELTVAATRDGSDVAGFRTVIPLDGAPVSIDPEHFEQFQQQRAEHRTRISELEAELAAASQRNAQQRDEFLAGPALPPVEWETPEILEITSDGKATFTLQEDGSYFVEGPNPTHDNYHLHLRLPFPLKELSGLRLELLPDERLTQQGVGRANNGNIVLSEVKCDVVLSGSQDERHEIPINRATADFEQDTHWIHQTIDGKENTGWAVAYEQHMPHAAVFEVDAENIDVADSADLQLHLLHRHGHHLNIGRFHLAVTRAPRPVISERLPTAVEEARGIPADQRTDEQQKLLTDYFTRTDATISQLTRDLQELRNHPPELPITAYDPLDDPFIPPQIDLVIEALIDGNSILLVARDQMVWQHETWEKPGWTDDSGRFVLVDGEKWYPEWKLNSAENAVQDSSRAWFLPIGPGLWDVEVLSITDPATGRESPQRGTVTPTQEDTFIKIDFNDHAGGPGEYRVRLTRRAVSE